jgi:hypothetical protein
MSRCLEAMSDEKAASLDWQRQQEAGILDYPFGNSP